jgi:hypothetical protein
MKAIGVIFNQYIDLGEYINPQPAIYFKIGEVQRITAIIDSQAKKDDGTIFKKCVFRCVVPDLKYSVYEFVGYE